MNKQNWSRLEGIELETRSLWNLEESSRRLIDIELGSSKSKHPLNTVVFIIQRAVYQAHVVHKLLARNDDKEQYDGGKTYTDEEWRWLFRVRDTTLWWLWHQRWKGTSPTMASRGLKWKINLVSVLCLHDNVNVTFGWQTWRRNQGFHAIHGAYIPGG